MWQASLDLERDVRAGLGALLSDDECARAERFYFERDRSRFVTGRGLLRLILSRYTGQPAERISFAYGAYRKPRLGSSGPWFNISHSGGFALFAVSSRSELGIDVELPDAKFAGEGIPEHFFSSAEVASLRSLPPGLQPRAFLECWTRKEAFIKARGDGMSLALDSFTVTLGPWEPAALLSTTWSSVEARAWRLLDLSDPDGRFVAALATRSKGWRVVNHRVDQIFENSITSDQEDR